MYCQNYVDLYKEKNTSRYILDDLNIIVFYVINLSHLYKCVEIFSLSLILKINYVEIVQFVELSRPYFDDFLSVYKEFQLKFVV